MYLSLAIKITTWRNLYLLLQNKAKHCFRFKYSKQTATKLQITHTIRQWILDVCKRKFGSALKTL